MARVQPVTDPAKRVTDALLLRELARQRVDSDFVEFHQDYAPRRVNGKVVKGRSPYAKFYRDLKSRKRFMVVSGLPKVRPDSERIQLGWSLIAGKYHSMPNLFSCVVDGTQVQLTCLFPQPWGASPGDVAIWNPQLFIDGIEQTCGRPRLLAIDPTNPDLMLNTLEWDYGACKRRIRLVHGRFRERWVFPENPNGDVRIKHNLTGNMPIKLGRARDDFGNSIKVQVVGDEELVGADEFNREELAYPVEIGASGTYYPDADAETSSVDGRVDTLDTGGLTTAEHRTQAEADEVDDSESENIAIGMKHHEGTDTDDWEGMWRAIFLFDTSGLDDDATVSAATMSAYKTDIYDDVDVTFAVNVYSSNPGSNTELGVGDYDSLGTSAFCDTPINHTAFGAGYNDFAFNATGIAAVSKTTVSKFGLRDATYDVGGSAANGDGTNTWGFVKIYYADQGSNQPKLVVTYTVPGGAVAMYHYRMRRNG